MKKILNLLLALCLSFYAFATAGLKFENNLTWAQIKAKAAKEKKMIFFDAYTTWCGPCKFLEEKVYTDASVAAYYNANYINVKFDMEDGEGLDLADEFEVTAYPTLMFFSADGKLVHKFVGAMKAPEFIQLGKDARDPARQYYTLKQTVIDHKAGTADFVKWTEMAEELEDADRGAVASDWLSTQDDILANAELAKAALLFSDVTEEHLGYLYQNQERIAELLGWDKEKITTTLYRKLFQLALTAGKDATRGSNGFENMISRFDKSRLQYALIDHSLMVSIYEDRDADAAMKTLINSLAGRNRLTLKEFCSLLIDYSPRFETEQVLLLNAALDKYVLSASDKGMECWFYIAQVIGFSKSGEIDKAKTAAEKAFRHPNTPEQYKQILGESFEISE